MAVTITVAELRAALRLNDSAEETAEVTRLLAYSTEAIEQHAPEASDTAMNEAVRRLGGYLFDQPEAARGDGYANALRYSGAARILLPYRVHRLGLAEAVSAAQAAVGTVVNPVTGLVVQGGQLVVTFEDGSTDALDLPAGQDAADQTARDSAAAAQSTIETHEASTHNHDAMARTATRAAQTAADAAAAAGAGRVDLYRDTATYRHTRASTIFRNIILSRPPARGRGLELVIASSSRTWTAPFYCGTTDDWIDLTLLTSSQVTARVSGAAASIQNTIPLKSISFGEDDTDAFEVSSKSV